MTVIESVMSTVASKLGLSGIASDTYHPLNPLTADEIARSVRAIKAQTKSDRLWFKSTQLIEPPKVELAPWLDAVAAGQPASRLPRKAETLLGQRRADGADWSGQYICIASLCAHLISLQDTLERRWHRHSALC